VVQTVSAERLMDKQFVRACQIIKEAHLVADQSVWLALNARITALVTARNALTLALERVE